MKQKIFDIAWRLAILSLPWQTRWFQDAHLAGWPWEQGRVSVYGSWIFLIAFIGISLLCHSDSLCHSERSKAESKNPFRRAILRLRSQSLTPLRMTLVIAIFFFSFFGSSFSSSSLRAIFQWWIQISLLVVTAFILIFFKIDQRKIATWFAFSLLPQALLAVYQFATQKVIGASWAGIATQLPQTLGVSVIGVERTLRAYGGFPHPNILGGWLAVGLIVALWLALTSSTTRSTFFWLIYSALISAALFFTFSRSAWIAAMISVCPFVILSHVTKDEESLSDSERDSSLRRASFRMTKKIIVLLLPLATIILLSIHFHPLLSTRFTSSDRLESKSIDVRAQSLRDGIKLFRNAPFFGTGPNVELPALANTPTPVPLESPHNVFLLALVNFGIIGFALLILLGHYLFRHLKRSQLFYPLIATLFILAMFDHYLWSYWSGQCLVMIGVVLTMNCRSHNSS